MTVLRSPRTCPDCGNPLPPHRAGIAEACPHCAVAELRESEATERRRARDADRDTLGLRPLTRALNFTRIAVDAGLHWTAFAMSFAEGDDARRIERVREHLAAARRELG